MSLRVGQIISTVPHIEAADMANKSQLSDAMVYLRKAQRYHNGSVYSSIQNSLLPYACSFLKPPMTKDDLSKKNRLPVKISQWIYKQIAKRFKKSGYLKSGTHTPDVIEKGLSLWWAFNGRDEKKTIKEQIAAVGADIRGTVEGSYVDFKTGGYKPKDKYAYLLNDKRKAKNES